MKQADKEKSAITTSLAMNQQELTLVSADLTDDQNYLKLLTANCNTKSKQWDQRSAARASELTALTSALTIIKGRVAAKVSDKTVRLVETGQKSPKQMLQLEATADDEDAAADAASTEKTDDQVLAMADAEADDPPVATSFLQLQSPRKKALSLVGYKKYHPGEFRDAVHELKRDALLKKAREESMQNDDEGPMQQQLERELALAAQREKEEKKTEDWAKNLPKDEDVDDYK